MENAKITHQQNLTREALGVIDELNEEIRKLERNAEQTESAGFSMFWTLKANALKTAVFSLQTQIINQKFDF